TNHSRFSKLIVTMVLGVWMAKWRAEGLPVAVFMVMWPKDALNLSKASGQVKRATLGGATIKARSNSPKRYSVESACRVAAVLPEPIGASTLARSIRRIASVIGTCQGCGR